MTEADTLSGQEVDQWESRVLLALHGKRRWFEVFRGPSEYEVESNERLLASLVDILGASESEPLPLPVVAERESAVIAEIEARSRVGWGGVTVIGSLALGAAVLASPTLGASWPVEFTLIIAAVAYTIALKLLLGTPVKEWGQTPLGLADDG